MKCLCLFLCALAFASAATIDNNKMVNYHGRVSENMNDYLDSVLQGIAPWLSENGLNPVVIPDVVKSFEVKPLLITYHGELSFKNGQLFNISEVLRRGDAFMTTNDNQVRIEATVAVTSIEVSVDYLAQIMNIGPYGYIEGHIGDIVVAADVVIEMGEKLKIILNDVQITEIGSVDIKLTGNVLTDWLGNAIVKAGVWMFKDSLTGFVSAKVRDVVQKMIDDLNNGQPEVANRMLYAALH